MRYGKATTILIAIAILWMKLNAAMAQVVPVQDGTSLTLKVTVTGQGVSASKSELLVVVKKLAPALQAGYQQPITQIQFVNPADGSVVATFFPSDWR
jgi:hypothetical protein